VSRRDTLERGHGLGCAVHGNEDVVVLETRHGARADPGLGEWRGEGNGESQRLKRGVHIQRKASARAGVDPSSTQTRPCVAWSGAGRMDYRTPPSKSRTTRGGVRLGVVS